MPNGFSSVEGAKSTAVFSFHETCKPHGVDLDMDDYLEFLFRYMGIHRDELKDESLSEEEEMLFLSRQFHGYLRRPEVLTLDLIQFFIKCDAHFMKIRMFTN